MVLQAISSVMPERFAHRTQLTIDGNRTPVGMASRTTSASSLALPIGHRVETTSAKKRFRVVEPEGMLIRIVWTETSSPP